jgi:outer membrane immunogenic protein
MKRAIILAAATIAVGTAAPAVAADLPARTYSKAPALEAAYDWSGTYVGFNGGAATGSFDWNADGFGEEGSHRATGGMIGGQFGHRWQMSSVVFGVEFQGDWASFTGANTTQLSGFAGNQNVTRVDGFGLVTGQIGYAWNRALFYVDGGGVVTDNHYHVINAGAMIDNGSETRWGAALGVGFEYAVSPNWSLGLQYNHLFMGNNDVIFESGAGTHISENADIITARLNYKFGEPVVARY